ncbi:flagellar basal body P-ring formation chaperone FlgA [Roseovarius pelagicus]|uniref:Flagella basal body P-ring formation protein FlgA n=1 Tax=Roseovarius pelagicus TaxID=2980108 RepID=A0ABY6D862_9RHOB|nr:flagellar basal body P-ring formation chaperone FlgA [Roseovarius pelagicus]UXX82283.1 flagellar basal body P-ring formation chaperone FlgA [Roseovarius pelagicus]
MRIPLVLWLLYASPACADTIVATRTIRAQTLITAQDIVAKDADIVGAISDASAIIGQEARVALYPGRPIRPGDIGPPAVVERNQIIILVFDQSGVTISTEGRSLSRAGPGERIRAMNLASRITVSGHVLPDGRVRVTH